MRDVFAIARFECSYQLRSPLFLLVAGVFALLTFLGMASESVTIGGSDKALHLNSVFAIIQTHLVFSILGMFPAIAFVAGAIGRDYEMRTAEIFYATGVRSTAFVLGRFFGGTTFAVLTGFAALLGTCIGTFAPWLDPARVGPFVLAPYLFTAFVIILPNLFFVCAAFFSVAALTRSMAAAYGAAMVFIVAYLVSNSFLGQEDLWWSVYADPFGGTAVAEAFRYATVSERNSSLPGGAIYLNRVIWLSAGLLILVLTTWRYRFELSTRKHRKQKSAPGGIPSIAGQPHVNRNPSAWQQFLSQTRMDVRGTLRSAPFYVVLAMGMINVLGNIFGSTSLPYDTSAYPVTSNILRAIEGGFLFFVLIIVVYYAAELIHRERATRMADILDATPFAGGIVVVAKLVAVLLVIGVLLLTVMLTGITVQLMTGDTPIQPLVYLQGLFGFGGGTFLHLAVVAVFLAVATANRWLGMLCMVALVLGLDALPSAGFEHNLYLFGMPPVVHSDMNGFGHFTTPYLWYFLYWSLFCVLLVLASHLLFPRGYLTGWAERLAVARQRLTRPVLITGGIALAGFAATGIWIHHNTNVLNDYLVNDTIEARQADYEKRFKPHELDPVPTVEAIDARVAIDPQRREIASSGIMRMHNLSGAAINGFLITVNPQLTVDQLAVDGARQATVDSTLGVYRVDFAVPLEADGTTNLRWDMTWRNPGFVNSRPNNRVVANGTFVDSTEIFPLPVYDSSRELADNNVRRKLGLPPVTRLPKLDDPKWRGRSQFGVAARAAFSVDLSTAPDQIAVAPGYLDATWEADGRKHFRYRMDAPIWPFFSFSSARYAVARDVWQDVTLEVYHDPAHTWNIESMLTAAKQSLDYFSREFSPYQYKQFRILEFPRYATFAQSFPNTVPFSEAIGFITDQRDAEDINLTFYVTAHEMAHQWWGHQVAGASMQGATIIVETLAQYSALMVMEKAYGEAAMRRFLRFELDAYLSARGGELIEELPLMLTENQPYLHYRKGSVAMYALRQRLGEQAVNTALRKFLKRYAFQPPPFPTSRDLVNAFRAEAPPEVQGYITDLFEYITLYDIRIADTAIDKEDNGYRVTVVVEAHKFHADGLGVETEVPLDETATVALLPRGTVQLPENVLPQPLLSMPRRLTTGLNRLDFFTGEKPERVVVDPLFQLIDRNPDDNLMAFD